VTNNNQAAPAASFDQDSARTFCGDLARTVDTLIEVLREETRLIKAARLSDAVEMSDRKSAISERYMQGHSVLRMSGGALGKLVPDEVGHLRERHQALEAAISQNLAVLATARTVSETLIRGVSETVSSRDGQSHTYGADARESVEAPRSAPLSYNIAL